MINANRTMSQRRKGTHKMITFKDLKSRFGQALAKEIRDGKKEAQDKKPASDSTCYWMKHPDTPNEAPQSFT